MNGNHTLKVAGFLGGALLKWHFLDQAGLTRPG